jgi:hypothetical protein
VTGHAGYQPTVDAERGRSALNQDGFGCVIDPGRRQPDSNRRSGFCRPLPYHLAMAPDFGIPVYHPH